MKNTDKIQKNHKEKKFALAELKSKDIQSFLNLKILELNKIT